MPAEFRAGDVVLQSGLTLPDARLVYELHGRPNAARDNVVVFPTRFGGTHADNAYLIGAGRALDPDRWCVAIAEPVVSLGVGLPLRQGPAGGGIDLDRPGAVSPMA